MSEKSHYCKEQRRWAWKKSFSEAGNTASLLLPPAILYAAVVAAESSVCTSVSQALAAGAETTARVGAATAAAGWADTLAACRAAAYAGGAGALAVVHPAAAALNASHRRQLRVLGALRVLLLGGTAVFAVGTHTLAYREGLLEWQLRLERGLGTAAPALLALSSGSARPAFPGAAEAGSDTRDAVVALRLGGSSEVCRLLLQSAGSAGAASALPILLEKVGGRRGGLDYTAITASASASVPRGGYDLAAAARAAHAHAMRAGRPAGQSSYYLRQAHINPGTLALPAETTLVVVQSSDLSQHRRGSWGARGNHGRSRTGSCEEATGEACSTRLAAAVEVATAVRAMRPAHARVHICHVGWGPAPKYLHAHELSASASASASPCSSASASAGGASRDGEVTWVDASAEVAAGVKQWASFVQGGSSLRTQPQVLTCFPNIGAAAAMRDRERELLLGMQLTAASRQASKKASEVLPPVPPTQVKAPGAAEGADGTEEALALIDYVGSLVRHTVSSAATVVWHDALLLMSYLEAAASSVAKSIAISGAHAAQAGSSLGSSVGESVAYVAAVPASVLAWIQSSALRVADQLPSLSGSSAAAPAYVLVDCGTTGAALCMHLNQPNSSVYAVSYCNDTWYKRIFSGVPGLTHVAGNLVVVSRSSDGMTLLAAKEWRSRGYSVLALLKNAELAAAGDEGLVGYSLESVADSLLQHATRAAAQCKDRHGVGEVDC